MLTPTYFSYGGDINRMELGSKECGTPKEAGESEGGAGSNGISKRDQQGGGIRGTREKMSVKLLIFVVVALAHARGRTHENVEQVQSE